MRFKRGRWDLRPVEDRGIGWSNSAGGQARSASEEGREAIPDEPLLSGIEAYVLADDGLIPNNAKLPLVLYRQALALDGLRSEPERAFEALFRSNGWRGAWVDGIYDFHHYHSTAHEVLGIAKSFARVQFGGPEGLVVDLTAGDVVLIPAGVGHCLIEGEDLVVVGPIPKGRTGTSAGRARPTMPRRSRTFLGSRCPSSIPCLVRQVRCLLSGSTRRFPWRPRSLN
jgi:uncharacterized protein YjlB